MRLTLNHIAGVLRADVRLDGITVVAGQNNTGKSTVGKALWCALNILDNPAWIVERERRASYQRILEEVFSYRLFASSVGRSRIGLITDLARTLIDNSANGPLTRDYVLEEILSRGRDFLDISFPADEQALNDSIDQIVDYSRIRSCDIERAVFDKMLSKEFNGQVTNVDNPTRGRIKLAYRHGELESAIESDRVSEFSRGGGLGMTAIYMDDPFVLNGLRSLRVHGYRGEYSYVDDHTSQLCALLSPHRQQAGDVLDSIVLNGKLEQVMESLSTTVDGSLVWGQERGIVYRRPNSRNDLDLRNISSGMKTFAIIKTLLQEGRIREGDALILDEPEVHLHPAWQLRFAQIIVMLHKVYELNVLLATHSPYFLRAIEVYSSHHEVADKCRYYHAVGDDEGSIFIDVTNETDEIYEDMSVPFRLLDELIPEE